MQWDKALTDNPLIPILRGLDPERAIEFAETLIDSTFRILGSADEFTRPSSVYRTNSRQVIRRGYHRGGNCLNES